MASSGLHEHALKHLVRRGMQLRADFERPNPSEGELPLAVGGMVVIMATILLFLFLVAVLRYTLWNVVNTLTIIETPLDRYVLEPASQPVDEDGNAIDIEVDKSLQRPITSGIRSTIRHLHQTAGFWSRWRGLVIYICYNIIFMLIVGFVSAMLENLPMVLLGFISPLVAALVLAHWSIAWTHIVISQPSPKPWYRRLPGFKATKNVWLPIVVNACAERLPYVLPFCMLQGFRLMPERSGAITVDDRSPAMLVMQLLSVSFVGLLAYVLIALPSKVALVRVQASMLPEEDESIVPFDRTFNNKVVPAIIGGSGAISFADSWRTFDREARLRVLKMVVKLCVIEVALHLGLALIVWGEIAIFLNPNAPKRDQSSPSF